MILEGIFRRFLPLQDSKSSVDLRSTFCESIATAQVEPYGVEMARAGRRFLLGNSASIIGDANTSAFPTLTTDWLLWNNDTSKIYFFETVGAYMTTGTPGAAGAVLLFCIATSPAQVGGQYAGVSVTSASGGNSLSKMIIGRGITLTTPTAPNWSYISDIGSENAAAFPGSLNLVNRDVAGRIAIQPGQGLGLAVLNPTGTLPGWAPFAEWVELEIDMQ